MNKKLVFMFSGQGSQWFRMGEELYRCHSVFRRQMQALDRVVVDKLGASVIETIYGATGKFERPFDQIRLTHPALFMVQYSLAKCLMEEDVRPSYVLGASLGEWVAIAVAGMLPVELALELVIKKAVLFEQQCPRGGMLAVLSSPDIFHRHRDWFSGCEFAGSSYPHHFCVSGDTASIDGAERSMRLHEISCTKLPLNQPFHSSLVEPLHDGFLRLLDDVAFSAGAAALVSSASACVMNRVSKQHFWDVIRKPIDFYRTVRNLSADSKLIYVDLGPSGTLANFVKYGLPAERYGALFRIMTPAGRDLVNYARVNNALKETVFLQRA